MVINAEKVAVSLTKQVKARHQMAFNPPGGPHFGGARVFEVMVKCAKSILYTTLCKADLTDEELLTSIRETEGLLNTRPSATVSDVPGDFKALTPENFWTGHQSIELALHGEEGSRSIHSRRTWWAMQTLLSCMWQ